MSTITKHACLMLPTTNHVTELSGYQGKTSPKRLPMVHCTIKLHIRNLEQPVIFLLNCATLLDDSNETESLLHPFVCMRHGIQMDLAPEKYGADSGMRIEGQFSHSITMMKSYFCI
jgi:hypothetical protein